MTTDNCGNSIDCRTCEAGVGCYTNVCGCMPDPVATTCAGKQCGQFLNNCNLKVNCGANGTMDCDGGDYCNETTGTCCTPDNSACTGRCNTSITNNCGITNPCPATCPGNGVCNGTTCCTPTGCGGNCLDNCGQKNASCCAPDAGNPPPLDSGSPPPDSGGGCAPVGSPCAYGCCSTLQCGQSDLCVAACKTSGAQCNTSSDCCYGLTCSGVVAQPLGTSQQAIGLPDSSIYPVGTCQ